MSLESNGATAEFPGYRGILGLMACVGAYALLAQILLLRELMVVFFGNELTIGAMLSAWLALIAAGSFLASFFVARWKDKQLRALLTGLLVLAAACLPLQLGVIRAMRAVFHVAYGEYVPFFTMLAGLALVLLPGCLIIGIIFPCACRLAARRAPYAASRVYTMESLGSMAAGAIFSFGLVWVLRPVATAALAGAIALLGAACLAANRAGRWLWGLIAFAFAVMACCPACLAPLERAGVELRWRSFGALPAPVSGAASRPAPRLLASCDSRYQNLALIAMEGQMTLYANGQVLAVFPDAVTGEHKIHFIMAQKPDARRILLMGGNPVNDIPELLKYPLEQLVYVELDDQIGRLLEPVAPGAYRRALRDPRLVRVHMDASRYVKQYGRRFPAAPLFDAVLVEASEPATIALNRFYTQEFYGDIRSILSPDGFLYTAVEASEELQGEAVFMGASIYKALRAVFGRVLVTAGAPNRFFAGATNSPVTLARAPLFRRSAGAALKTRYFRPEYFLNADEISPDKLDFVERRLAAVPVPANTILKPVATFYQVMLWSRFSGSGLEYLLARLTRMRIGRMAGALLACGVICLGAGALLGRRPIRANLTLLDPMARGQGRGRLVFYRSMLALVMAATGLCGMAMELTLIFIFQALLGYVYSKIGLIAAVFMAGLTLGALRAPRLARRGAGAQWRAMAGVEILLIAEAAGIPRLLTGLNSGLMNGIPWGLAEALIYGAIALTGVLVGVQFALVNELMYNPGSFSLARARMPRPLAADAAPAPVDPAGARGRNAAFANTADLAGAALGGLAVGVLLLPLFGIAATCLILAALKAASLMGLLAARRAVCAGERAR